MIKISKNEFLLFFFLVSFWMLSRPYAGIWHDSLLYAAQAFSRLYPDIFGHDIFFLYGSQDSFTAFTPVYATAIQLFGLNYATIILLILGHVAWILGAIKLFRKFSTELIGWYGIALVFTMPASYGGFGIFSYGESFLSPRVFAEALVMIALSEILHGRILPSFLIVIASAMLHPLVAIAGILTITIYLSLSTLRWFLTLIVSLSFLLVISTAEIEPLIGLNQIMGSEWFNIVKEVNNYVFPSSWRGVDWSRFSFDLLVNVCGCFVFKGRRRLILIAVGLSGIAGVVISLLGAELLKNAMLIQLQTWRSAWLLHVFSNFTIALLADSLWRSENRRILICLFLSAWFLIPFKPFISTIICLLATILTILELNGRLTKIFKPACHVALLITVIFGCYGTAVPIILIILRWQILWQGDYLRLAVELIKNATILSAVACLMLWLLKMNGKIKIIFAIALLSVSIITWDRRDQWDYYIENFYDRIQAFKTPIPSSSNIYWEDDLKSSWLVLKRANYVSLQQAGGVLFSKKTADTYALRKKLTQYVLGPIDSMRSPMDYASMQDGYMPVNSKSIIDSCISAPNLDFLILTRGVTNFYVEKWIAPYEKQQNIFINGKYEKRVSQDYYLYDCRTLRHLNQIDKSSENG